MHNIITETIWDPGNNTDNSTALIRSYSICKLLNR